ncbi:MAG TPA: hypothetical protein VGM57_14005 [Pseudolabrys sp.]|jgi:hypothetical protein
MRQHIAGAIVLTLALVSPAAADPDFEVPDNAPRVVDSAAARSGCLPEYAEPIVERPCQLAKFGSIGTIDGHSFNYARYAFTTEGGGTMGARVLIFERASGDKLRILFVPENVGGPFSDPELIKSAGRTLLLFPGFDTGTGNFNRERLYVWRQSEWHVVDTTSWLDTLNKRLPKGLAALKGIYPDYRRMTATTPLWHSNDGNASPSRGNTLVRLAWKGDTVILQSVSVRRR